MKAFFLCFIPMFVAVNAIGVLPLYIGLTRGIGKKEQRRMLVQSFFTGSIVATLFDFAGQKLFRLLGITVADFMIAGGILLFVISMSGLVAGRKMEREGDAESFGAVPIGVPLIVGPAVLTTVVILADQYGHFPTVLSIILNVLIAVVLFSASDLIAKLLGKPGMRTISKIAQLILAAIAVMFIRKGILNFGG